MGKPAKVAGRGWGGVANGLSVSLLSFSLDVCIHFVYIIIVEFTWDDAKNVSNPRRGNGIYEEIEMKKEYDFSHSVPNRHVKAVKKGIHIRLDQDVIDWLKAQALKQEIGYQTLANSLLREQMQGFDVVPSVKVRLEKLEHAIFKKKKAR
jgi:uncharacterized protein (DUF4415 family)